MSAWHGPMETFVSIRNAQHCCVGIKHTHCKNTGTSGWALLCSRADSVTPGAPGGLQLRSAFTSNPVKQRAHAPPRLFVTIQNKPSCKTIACDCVIIEVGYTQTRAPSLTVHNALHRWAYRLLMVMTEESFITGYGEVGRTVVHSTHLSRRPLGLVVATLSFVVVVARTHVYVCTCINVFTQ